MSNFDERLNMIRYSLQQAYQNCRSAGYRGSFYNWLDDNETVDTEITEYRRLKRLANEPA
jgi:hypothetical protein